MFNKTWAMILVGAVGFALLFGLGQPGASALENNGYLKISQAAVPTEAGPSSEEPGPGDGSAGPEGGGTEGGEDGGPVGPADPNAPGGPAGPTDPEDPEGPEDPTGPEDAPDMEDPEDPAGPGNPDSPDGLAPMAEDGEEDPALQQGQAPSIGLGLQKGRAYYLPLEGSGIQSFKDVAITVSYEDSALRLADAAAHLPGVHAAPGAAAGELAILSCGAGEIALTFGKQIPAGKEWSGLITMLKFEALKDGETQVSISWKKN